MKTSRFSWEMIVAGLALTIAAAFVIDKSNSRKDDYDSEENWSEAAEAPEFEIPAPPAPPSTPVVKQRVKIKSADDHVFIRLDGIENPEELKGLVELKKAKVLAKLSELQTNEKFSKLVRGVQVKTEDGQVVIFGDFDSADGEQIGEEVASALDGIDVAVDAAMIAAEPAIRAAMAEAERAESNVRVERNYNYSRNENSFSNFSPTFSTNSKGVSDVTLSTSGGNIQIVSADVDMIEIMVKPSKSGISEAEINEHFDIHYKTENSTVRVEVVRKSGSKMFETNFGMDVFAKVPSGKRVSGTTKGGNVTMSDFEGRADLTTFGGNIKLSDFSGDLKAETRGGNIVLADVTGRLDIQTRGGNIDLADVNADMKAHTNGGNVKLIDVSGKIEASTNGGNIKADISEISGPCDLKTNAGNIDILIPEGIGMNLDLKGMTVSLPGDESNFKGTQTKTRAEGKLNDGGFDLRASTSVGKVSVRN